MVAQTSPHRICDCRRGASADKRRGAFDVSLREGQEQFLRRDAFASSSAERPRRVGGSGGQIALSLYEEPLILTAMLSQCRSQTQADRRHDVEVCGSRDEAPRWWLGRVYRQKMPFERRHPDTPFGLGASCGVREARCGPMEI